MFPNPFFAAMGGPFGPGLNNMGGMPGAGMPGQGLPGFMGNQGMQGPGMQQGPAGPMVPMTANQDGQGGGGSGGGGGGGTGRQGGDKNRYCKMFMQTGSCSYGEACKYPHITREILQNGGGAMQGGGGGGMGNQQADRRGDRRGGRGAGAGGGGGIGGGGGGGGSGGPGGGMVEEEASGRGKNQGARKTRLCDKFMTQGYCPYGSACTFAHGMEELRQPGSREGGQQQQQPISPPPTAVPGPAPPPEPYPGTAAARGQTAPSGQQGAKPASGGNNDGTAAAGAPTAGAATAQTTGNSAKEVTFVDKVRALCGVLGIGNAAALAADKPLALQTAAMSLRNANAFKENPFADSVERYIATQQGQG